MTKKVTRKKSTTKKSIQKYSDEVFLENFVSLQKVLTNLSIRFDLLSDNITRLLELFELTAKAMAEKDFEISKGSKEEKEMSQKMDMILEQNKILARGLTLLHTQNPPQIEVQPNPMPPRRMAPPQGMKAAPPTQGYQRSISAEPPQGRPMQR